jgi:hypothetical protein
MVIPRAMTRARASATEPPLLFAPSPDMSMVLLDPIPAENMSAAYARARESDVPVSHGGEVKPGWSGEPASILANRTAPAASVRSVHGTTIRCSSGPAHSK